ncbi:MAG: hypothetical protein ACWA41_10910 [Putridiphycobacter sp.]
MTIRIFYPTNNRLIILPEVSQYFTESNLIPNVGDRIVLDNNDTQVMSEFFDDFDGLVTIKEKIFNTRGGGLITYYCQP